MSETKDIIFDRECGASPFWLRATDDDGATRIVELPRCLSLPDAVQAADKLGEFPTHWIEKGSRVRMPIPSGIVRPLLSAPTA